MDMSKEEKIVYVLENEEIASVVGKLIDAREKKVVFVFTDNSRILHNTINLKLLKREAESLGKNIFIFNSHPYMEEVSMETGIPLYGGEPEIIRAKKTTPSVKPFKMVDIIRPQPVKARAMAGRPEETLPDAEQKPKQKIESDYYFDDEEDGDEDYFEEKIFDEDEGDVAVTIKRAPEKEQYLTEDEDRPFLEREDERIERAKNFFDTFKEGPREFTDKKKKFSFKAALLIFAGAIMAVFLVVLYFISANIKIDIFPKKSIVDFEIGLSGQSDIKDVDYVLSKISVEYIKIEKNDVREFTASGRKTVEDKARGKIKVFNAHSSSAQALVATTRFVNNDGIIFRLVNTITVPGAKVEDGEIIPSFIEADVVADKAGEEYNIGPSDFKIPGFEGTPKYNSFYGKSENPMTSGAIGEKSYITAGDIESAKKTMVDNLTKVSEGELAISVPENYKLLNEAKKITIADFSTSLAQDAIGDKFSALTKIKIEGIIFKAEDINSIIEQSLRERTSQEKNIEINWSKAVLNYKSVKPDFLKKSMELLVSGNIETVENIDIEGIKKEVSGKSIDDLKSILFKNNSIEESKIVLRPSWIRNVPTNPDKIEITIHE